MLRTRGSLVYLFLYVLLRTSGKRTLADVSTFDFLLLLIVGEATQQALLGADYSVINAVLVISVLVGLDQLLALAKRRSPRTQRILDGAPLVVVEEGRMLEDRMRREGVDRADVLAAARAAHGLERLEQIKYAVIETHGGISIVPAEGRP